MTKYNEGSKSTHSQGLYLTGFGEAGEYMYTLKPGFEYQSDFLSPVSLNIVSLEVTLNYFAENPKPGQFEKVNLSACSGFSNGYLYSVYQTSVMMKAYGDFKFQIHGIDASLPILNSGLYPTLVYSNDKLHIALGNYFELFLNKRDFLFKMRYFDENRIEFSVGYNLNQKSGIYKLE